MPLRQHITSKNLVYNNKSKPDDPLARGQGATGTTSSANSLPARGLFFPKCKKTRQIAQIFRIVEINRQMTSN
jgi:hypothetical protein